MSVEWRIKYKIEYRMTSRTECGENPYFTSRAIGKTRCRAFTKILYAIVRFTVAIVEIVDQRTVVIFANGIHRGFSLISK